MKSSTKSTLALRQLIYPSLAMGRIKWRDLSFYLWWSQM